MPGSAGLNRRRVRPSLCQNRLTMVMIRHVVAVAMHGPNQVFFKSMGVAMRGDHLGMLLQGLDNFGDMRRAWRYGPEA